MNSPRPIEIVDPFRGPYFDAKTAAAYVPCRAKHGPGFSVKAFWAWRRRHGILTRANGSVAKADLDRVLRRRRPRRVLHPNSLANLQKQAS